MSGCLRLDKFLTSQNICSRKEASQLARKKLISVNGDIIQKADIKIDPNTDMVIVNGKKVNFREHLYIMMNKPKGVLSATEDGRGSTVLDLLPENMIRRGLFPAGRLDKDTTGLIIITDDGDFAHKMLAPKSHVFKLYEAVLDKPAEKDDIEKFKEGIKTETAQFMPAEMWWEDINNPCTVRVRIREGKFHQVKRMFAYCGKIVQDLQRLEIGGLALDTNLAEGEARFLSESELESIFSDNVH